jgi:threonine/homoserine/homoserine lactone efflux protein
MGDDGFVSSASQFVAFVLASILFIQVPGPSLLFTIGRALTVGRRDALLSAVGNGIGVFGQIIALAVGLGALVAASATAFTVLKLAGAAYVVYLGVQAIRHRGDARLAMADMSGTPRSMSAWGSIRTGIVVGVTNPKTLVFFAAFLPQFIDPSAPAAVQLLALGGLFCAMAIVSDGCWVVAASKARDWFAREPRRLDHLGAAGGTMMIGLGATLATTGTANH